MTLALPVISFDSDSEDVSPRVVRRELVLDDALFAPGKSPPSRASSFRLSSPQSPAFVREFSPLIRHASLRVKEQLRTRLSEPLREQLSRSFTRLGSSKDDLKKDVDADDESSSSGEEDDPELRELEERDNIVSNKNADEATEEERANRRRVEKEIRRVNKWLAMEAAWKKGRIPKKLEERTWKGIPEKLRMTIWPRLLGAVEMKEARPDVYYQLLMRARLVSKDIKQIDLDINRTYRDHISFRRRYDVKQQSLLNVLAAYSMYNTEVGYCQGMSQIAALFLMYLDEEDTFWCIHALMVGRKHTMHGKWTTYLDSVCERLVLCVV
ncbi:TBC domain protein [Oesophagostomum dentatum]|uniref:TBC domain protein n=1 Tax=Oesophagostomum dentatum TaxID=61180 RepID=A0A0B1TG90_OESDE|nr:TBC domain protein [Oesophagostomum dentatum]